MVFSGNMQFEGRTPQVNPVNDLLRRVHLLEDKVKKLVASDNAEVVLKRLQKLEQLMANVEPRLTKVEVTVSHDMTSLQKQLDRERDIRVELEERCARYEQEGMRSAMKYSDYQSLVNLFIRNRDKNTDEKLVAACREGNRVAARFCLDIGASPDIVDEERNTLLHISVLSGEIDLVQMMLDAGIPVQSINDMKETPLHISAKRGFLEATDLLLMSGAEVNTPADQQRTALHLAADNNQVSTCLALLTAKANVNALDDKHYTPLMLAASRGYTNVCHTLIEARAELDTLNKRQKTALMLAARYGYYEVCKILLKAGADLNICDNEELAALHIAAQNNFLAIVQLFVSHRADISAVDYHGHTAAEKAKRRGHKEIYEYLSQDKSVLQPNVPKKKNTK